MTRNMPRAFHAAPRLVVQHEATVESTEDAGGIALNTDYQTAPPTRAQESSHNDRPTKFDASKYTKPFISFMSDNPTAFHAVAALAEKLQSKGFTKLSERELWADKLKKGGKYFYERHGSSIIAFAVGDEYKSGNGAAVIASHIDSLAARVKPVSTKPTDSGVMQLGVGPYGGALSHTWFDRDLAVGGRVLVRNHDTGKVDIKLTKLDRPIARIPSIAPHFRVSESGHYNKEIRMVPIIGLDNSDLVEKREENPVPALSGAGGHFASTQPERLVRAISREIGVKDYIVGWELELFDSQPAQVGGLDGEFIFAGRLDDKLCSWAAMEGLLASSTEGSSVVKLVACFDDEEIGSLQRQGARGNMLPSTIERICEAFSDASSCKGALYQMYANSFLVSADVCHSYQPNYGELFLRNHSPRLNVGVAVTFDPDDGMTTDGPSYALLSRIASRCDSVLQLSQSRNDTGGGGTVGPMLSAATGMRAIDAGIPQYSMHSIRATTGDQDPGLGVQLFKGFFDHYEEVDKEFQP